MAAPAPDPPFAYRSIAQGLLTIYVAFKTHSWLDMNGILSVGMGLVVLLYYLIKDAVLGVLLAVLAYFSDSLIILPFKTLLSVYLCVCLSWGDEGDAVIIGISWLMASQFIALALPFEYIVSTFVVAQLVPDVLVVQFWNFAYSDDPPDSRVRGWDLDETILAASYVITMAGLTAGRQIFAYVTRNIKSADELSATLFLGICFSLGFRALFVEHPWRIVRDTRDRISVLDNRLEINWLLILDWLHRTVRTGFERLDAYRIRILDLESYVYTPLDRTEGTTQIRLLRLKKRTPLLVSGLIKADLFSVDLHDVPDYEALSYTWGDPTRRHDIVLNGKRLRVPTSLHRMLHARSSWRERILWVDFICIDQNNIPEKEHQIPLMKDIYTKASRVIAWLGDAHDASLGAKMLKRVSDTIEQSKPAPEILWHTFRQDWPRPRWKALVKLMSNPYFSRVWICQEVSVASKIYIYHGGKYFEWDKYTRVVMTLSTPQLRPFFQTVGGEISIEHMDFSESTTVLHLLRLFTKHSVSLSIGAVLSQCVTFKASQPEDRIFALLGLTPKRSPLPHAPFLATAQPHLHEVSLTPRYPHP